MVVYIHFYVKLLNNLLDNLVSESDLDCDFEDGSTCGYQQDTETSHFEWMLQTAVSPSGETGPYWDHTRKNASGKLRRDNTTPLN